MKLFVFSALAAIVAGTAFAQDDFKSGFDYVAEDGTISFPDAEFRKDWPFLGTWVLGGDEEPATGVHNVYTQPGTIEAFRETGKFPDGAVLVKELLGVEHNTYTTGPASYAGHIEGWFVMIKDSQDRYPDSGLWGDGWGWSFFDPKDTSTSPTKDYKAECIGCHVPAQDKDWIYTEAYPVLFPSE